MIHGLQKSLIFLVILLQLITPFVHAHTRSIEQHGGLHMPGLEWFAWNADVDQEYQKQPALNDSLCMFITVSSGMQLEKTDHPLALKNIQRMPPGLLVFSPTPLALAFIRPFELLLNGQITPPDTAPRAPPSYI